MRGLPQLHSVSRKGRHNSSFYWIMKTRNALVLLMAAVALIASPRALARAPAHRPITHPIHAAPSELVRLVFDDYLKIQAALAQDSLEGVSQSASAMAKAIRDDPSRTFPQRVVRQAERLAQAQKLAQARAALVRLTFPLAEYARKNQLAGFYEGWCPMQRAYWLQAGQSIVNPYMGKAIPRCG